MLLARRFVRTPFCTHAILNSRHYMELRPWKTLTSRPVYANKWIRVREDVAALPNGQTTLYGVVTMGHAAGVLPFVDDDHVILVRQYRYVFGEAHRWEIPTGGLLAGEAAEAGALRELQEEIGYTAGTLEWVSTFYSSKSICEETCHLFIGRDLQAAPLPPDATEELEVATFAFADVVDMVRKSEIRDAMSVIAILHAAQLRA
jgi:ADP-ribose pyrophosphatase